MEDEIIERTFHFRLSQACEVIYLGNSQGIEFITEEKGGKKFLTGFRLTIKETTESVAVFSAKQKAINLSNFISVKYWHHVSPIFEGFSRRNKNGTITTTAYYKHGWRNINDLNFDSNDMTVQHILNDTERNILYEHVSRALKAADNEDPVTIIRELYHVIERNRPDYLNKFENLRDVLSHKGPIWRSTIQNLEDGFGQGYFTFTPNNDFDYTSPQNIEHLEIQARYLMIEVLKSPLLNQ